MTGDGNGERALMTPNEREQLLEEKVGESTSYQRSVRSRVKDRSLNLARDIEVLEEAARGDEILEIVIDSIGSSLDALEKIDEIETRLDEVEQSSRGAIGEIEELRDELQEVREELTDS